MNRLVSLMQRTVFGHADERTGGLFYEWADRLSAYVGVLFQPLRRYNADLH
jgi:hypothetical protein